jgi:hypothetical protein
MTAGWTFLCAASAISQRARTNSAATQTPARTIIARRARCSLCPVGYSTIMALAQLRENFSVQVVADLESGLFDQVVEDWPDRFNQSGPFCIG